MLVIVLSPLFLCSIDPTGIPSKRNRRKGSNRTPFKGGGGGSPIQTLEELGPRGIDVHPSDTVMKWEKDVGLLVNWLYFCAIMMVNSGYLSLEKILPPQVVSSLLEGPKELGHPPHRLNRYVA